jgi:hypothetical protein
VVMTIGIAFSTRFRSLFSSGMNGTASECEFAVLRATPSAMQHGCKGICCRHTAADPEMKDSKKNIDPQVISVVAVKVA